MPKTQAQILKSGILELTAEDSREKWQFGTSVSGVLEQLGVEYTAALQKSLRQSGANTSGKLADSIKSLPAKIDGKKITVEIEANKYASYLDEGVDGWAKSRGSRFKFKSKGMPKEAIDSLEVYLKTKKSFATKDKGVFTKIEKQSRKISKSKSNANTVAFMIKRQGIKPNRFWSKTTTEFRKTISKELGVAIKIDVINTLVK